MVIDVREANAPALAFGPLPRPVVPLRGVGGIPVHRIFCVGRNYVAHALEMGAEVDREAPFYFLKGDTTVLPSGATLPYPPGTDEVHHEMELVVAIGRRLFSASPEEAAAAVLGYAAGLDMTRRDLQAVAKAKGRPWDLAKNFEGSAVIGEFVPAADFGKLGPQRISLAVNGETRQDARLSDLVWPVPELLAHLSRYYHLGPGDLLFTGTPAGVGPVASGDRLEGRIDGLAPVVLDIGPAE